MDAQSPWQTTFSLPEAYLKGVIALSYNIQVVSSYTFRAELEEGEFHCLTTYKITA
jgi:hypothetical protein